MDNYSYEACHHYCLYPLTCQEMPQLTGLGLPSIPKAWLSLSYDTPFFPSRPNTRSSTALMQQLFTSAFPSFLLSLHRILKHCFLAHFLHGYVHSVIIHLRYLPPRFVILPRYVTLPDECVDGIRPA